MIYDISLNINKRIMNIVFLTIICNSYIYDKFGIVMFITKAIYLLTRI